MALLEKPSRVPPVWTRLPSVFGYPFHFDCVVAIVGYTLLYLVGLVLPLIGLVLVIAAYAGIYKFAADVLESTAKGWMTPPETRDDGNNWMLMKHLGLILGLMLALMTVLILTASLALTAVAGLVFMFAMPAAIIIVVMTSSLVQALNPGRWLEVIRGTGKAYLVAVGLLVMLGASQGFAQSLLVELAGFGLLAAAGAFLIGGYFTLASYHLMGYLVYEKHEALGLEVDVLPVSEREREREALSPLLGEVAPLVEAGDVEAAIERLHEGIRAGALAEEHDRYRQLLALKGRREALLEHARDYIPVLLHAFDQPKKAMILAEESLAMDPTFRPREPGQVRELAELLDRFDRHESVLRLTSGFAQAQSRHPDIVANYLLAARALWFGRGEDGKALELVRNLLATYPAHPRRGEMETMAATIERGLKGRVAPGHGTGIPS